MTLIAIDTVLRKLQVTTDIGSYNALFYELLTLLDRKDFELDISRYSQLFSDSILPGEFNYDLHAEQPVYWDYFVKLRQELHYKLHFLLQNTKPKRHASAREHYFEYLTSCHKTIMVICSVLFNPKHYRIQLRYYDGLIYSYKYCDYETPFPSLNYEHFIYRCLADNSYYVTKLDLLRGNHRSSPLTPDEKYPGELRPLYQHLWPELSV